MIDRISLQSVFRDTNSHLGNCIQNCHLGRNMVGNWVLRWHPNRAVKRDIQRYTGTSPNEIFGYGYPHSNALLKFCLSKWIIASCIQAACDPMKCEVINELFLTVYRSPIYCRKFWTSDQTSHYKIKCIWMLFVKADLWPTRYIMGHQNIVIPNWMEDSISEKGLKWRSWKYRFVYVTSP